MRVKLVAYRLAESKSHATRVDSTTIERPDLLEEAVEQFCRVNAASFVKVLPTKDDGTVPVGICCPICCTNSKHSYMLRHSTGVIFCPNEPHSDWSYA